MKPGAFIPGGERRRRRRSSGGGGGMLSFIPRPIRRFVPGTLVVIVGIVLVSVFSDNIETFVTKVKTWLHLGGETPPPASEA